MNPLDMKGEQFLVFYAYSCGIILVVALCMRWILRGPGASSQSGDTEDLDAYEIAAISGGERGAIRAAVASLFQRGALIAGAGAKGIARGPVPVRQAHPLEKAVLYAVPDSGEVNYDELERAAKSLAQQVRVRPQSLGLLLTPSEELLAWLLPMGVAMLVPILGFIKMGVGASRNRPIGFLVLATIGSIILLIAVLRRRKTSTRAGDTLLRRHQKTNAALKATSETSGIALTPLDVALAFALFGPTSLSGGTLNRLRVWYSPPVNSGGGGGSCSSSSCGGGGCGGGCGGGGCGGCGS